MLKLSELVSCHYERSQNKNLKGQCNLWHVPVQHHKVYITQVFFKKIPIYFGIWAQTHSALKHIMHNYIHVQSHVYGNVCMVNQETISQG